MAVHFERIPSTDPRLGRHVRHDDRSRAFAYPTVGLTLASAKHARRIPVLDQGQLGSCTGNAGIGALGTDPFYDVTPRSLAMYRYPESTAVPTEPGCQHPKCVLEHPHAGPAMLRSHYSFDEAGAVQLYSDATKLDDAPGSYPPDDTGSDGLSVAKVLKAAGEISGYQHTFTLTDALLALGQTPVITGVNWYEGMFNPDAAGRLHITGALAGAHEFVVDEIDVERELVWMTNSWGTGWGILGRACLTFDDWGTLLGQQGDVTVFTPLTSPAPTPTPPPVDPDQALAAVARPWVRHLHTPIAGDSHMKTALKAWLTAKGL